MVELPISFGLSYLPLPINMPSPIQIQVETLAPPLLHALDTSVRRRTRTPPRPEVADDDLAGLTVGPVGQVISSVLITT